MSKSITVIISTVNERVNNLVIPDVCKNIEYLIVHQVYSDLENVLIPAFIHDRPDVKYKKLNYPGLSKSRNIGISETTTRYAYLMDDDVEFDVTAIAELARLMDDNRAGVSTCRHKLHSGNLAKKYKDHSYEHNILTLAKVSSIDIMIDVNEVCEKSISFDERFGLGSALPSGEEYIYLTDCLKKGIKVMYFPITVGLHPDVTSGMDFFSNNKKILAKREMIRRVFGWKSPLFIFVFWLKKFRIALAHERACRFTNALFFGDRSLRKDNS